jgi:hypothetical protein
MEFLSRLGRRFNGQTLSRAAKQILGNSLAIEHLLPHLAEVCGAHDPAPKSGDLFMQGRHAGRRDIWLEIQSLLHLSDEEVVALLRGRAIERRDEH